MIVIPYQDKGYDYIRERFELNGEMLCQLLLARQKILPPPHYVSLCLFRNDKKITISNREEHPDMLISYETTRISALLDRFSGVVNVLNVSGFAGEIVEVSYYSERGKNKDDKMRMDKDDTNI